MHAALWIPQKEALDLGTLGGDQSEGFGINELSRVVGWFQDELGRTRPTLWRPTGAIIDLGTLSSGARHATVWYAAKGLPQDPIEQLETFIEGLLDDGLLNEGRANALLTKVDKAVKLMEKNPNAAIYVLNAFINQVEAFMRSGRLPEGYGETLIEIAEAFIDQLEG